MALLRITQAPGKEPNRWSVTIEASDIPDRAPLRAAMEIGFTLSADDRERIRWYLEDYLQFDQEPAPSIAKGVEALMAECGDDLFRQVFEGSHEARRLWDSLEPHLSMTRIEVETGIAEATTIPWELIRNPYSRTYLALSARAFVRSQRGGQTVLPPAVQADKVRILLVICRPHGGEDVPFRSVAGKLVTGLTREARDAVDLDVLRPPTYEQLSRTLHRAKDAGRPYHIVHFDGHGTYADAQALAKVAKVLDNLKLKIDGSGPRGFLAFEDPANDQNCEFVDGFRLGALLRDTGVPVLVLNACQSAFADAPAEPAVTAGGTRDEVEAYGSLGQAVMEAGAAGVVAMRYSVYVVTAAQFVAELYDALARGRTLGEAVTWARKNLADEPERRIAYEGRPLQDWSVPVVWERAPLRLWREQPVAPGLRITLGDEAGAAAAEGALDRALPPRPDLGFFGRDETLYALDRAFDTDRIVLLHAFAGSGKTATAAEFARWYAQTGGIEGPVLFSTFERHLPLARVLDKIGEVFGRALEQAGVQWDAIIDPQQRRDVALQVLEQIPVLWIWDNVEPVTGFPAGTPSDWSAEEQQELRDFLAAARDGQAKFLLTSRRDERAWLGDLARCIAVPPMPMQERLQLADEILRRRGRRLAELPDLTPLLQFTQGNPLTILVTVGEALRAGIDTKARLDAFVAALRVGEVVFKNETSEGRTTSLGASLSYGFDQAFSEEERKILALLHLFQGVVNVDVLRVMGDSEADWCIDAVRGLTRERGIALLDRAAEIGLLHALGPGYYGIHPALPWFFRGLFACECPETGGDARRARHAFVAAMGALGNFYFGEYDGGKRKTLHAVVAEEDNLLAAWRLARANGWWDKVIESIQCLGTLYDATGRRAAWRRLVAAVVPDFVDPATDGPLPGREDQWSLVTQYRVRFARQDRDWSEAERLMRTCVEWCRTRAAPALALAADQRTEAQHHAIRTVAVSLHELGQIQLEQGHAICVASFRESLDLAGAIGDTSAQATCAFNLGHAYKNIAEIRDLDVAERWYRYDFELTPATDKLGRGKDLAQLGAVAYERFAEARTAERPIEELKRYLGEAARLYEEALAMMPPSAIVELGITHNQLGNILNQAGDIDGALHHYRQGIRYTDEAGDVFNAGRWRFNVAQTLRRAARLPDARAYAEAALANFQTFGTRAAADIEQTERLLAAIDQAIAAKGGGA